MNSERVPGASSRAARPRILVVGAGPFQLEILRAARDVGEVVVVDGSPHAPGLALGDVPRVVDIADADAVVRVAQELKIDGVVTAASDVAVPAVSAVVQELGLVGMAPVVAQRCRDKLECFECVSAAGQVVPETRAVEDALEAEAAVQEVGGYPAIVKPRSGGGGRGVSLVQRPEDLPAALACARRAYGPGTRGVLVQEFISGRSVGVEAFFVAGKLAGAFVLDDHFEQTFIAPAGHALPGTLDAATEASVRDAVEDFGRALGLSDGPANFDLRYVNGRTVMLEVNPRLGGNSITDLVRASYGVDLAVATVAAALGRDPRPLLARKLVQPTAARLILKHGHGTARCPDAMAGWSGHPDVLSLDLLVSDGQPALVRVDEWTILGRAMVRGASTQAAAELAEQVAHDVAARITLA
ncbi:MAG TPA: ATP-grasp domain-containing protein [Polyangiales bacterium]